MGVAINLLAAYADMTARRHGEEISDPEEQYRILKANEPIIDEQYELGKMSEEKYIAYKKALFDWEE